MLERQFPDSALAVLADAVSQAHAFEHACELITQEAGRVLGATSAMFVRHQGQWVMVNASTDAAFDRSASLHTFQIDPPARESLVELGDRIATVFVCSPDRDVVWVVEGQPPATIALRFWSLTLGYALHALRARLALQRTDKLLTRTYAMARRLSRGGTVDTIAHRIVADVARLLDVDRVSLALYRRPEGRLSIAAAYGGAMEGIEDARIAPGEWVIGHVYATARPVIVSDVRLLNGSDRSERYRTPSFVAVPVLVGGETIGVLSMTDKRDDAVFDNADVTALRAIAGWTGIALVSAEVEAEAGRLAYAATIDSLTGLLNRRYLDIRLHQEVERAKRENNSVAVLLGDVDDFKTINDRYGHHSGDAVLQTVSQVIRSSLRVFDVCARYGGDEFAVVMPNCDRAQAMACAERIRRRLVDISDSPDTPHPRVTMSIGVAVFKSTDSASDVIERADRCMYQAKAQGKNLALGEDAVDMALVEVGHPADSVPPRLLQAVLAAPPNHARASDTESEARDLPFILVADANIERAALCRDSVSQLQFGLLMVRDGEQALRAIARFGSPALLIVDLALPVKNGFELIDAVRHDARRHTEIIAWASSRAMREYASARLAGRDVFIFGDKVSPAVLRAAITRALQPQAEATIDTPVPPESDRFKQAMSELCEDARQLCRTPGAAVYFRPQGESQFRATFAWMSDEVMPTPSPLPAAVDRVTRTGETLRVSDTGEESTLLPASDERVGIGGFAAVPIVLNNDISGAICVFDSEAVEVTDSQLEELRALGKLRFEDGRIVIPASAASPARGLRTGQQVAWPAPLLERQGGEFAVARELARARRERQQLSVILFDVAESGGEPAVQEHLVPVTETLLKTIRQSDLPILWSSRELLVVLPGLAGEQARTVAERVRAALHAGTRHAMAISGGVAEVQGEEGFGEVVDRARDRVEMARNRGHNRVM